MHRFQTFANVCILAVSLCASQRAAVDFTFAAKAVLYTHDSQVKEMAFLTLDFWLWFMRVLMPTLIKILIPTLAFMTLVFAISPQLFFGFVFISNQYGNNWKELKLNQEYVLAKTSGVERGMFKALYAMAEDRPLTAGVSMLVMLFSALLW